jgi:hypothetical protein
MLTQTTHHFFRKLIMFGKRKWRSETAAKIQSKKNKAIQVAELWSTEAHNFSDQG